LWSFPLLDTAKGTNFAFSWVGCSGLTTFPRLNLGNMIEGSGCFDQVTLPAASYDNILIDLANRNTNTGVRFSGGFSVYDDRAAISRNSTLVTGRGWTIRDWKYITFTNRCLGVG
jgi:hypothetical protein